MSQNRPPRGSTLRRLRPYLLKYKKKIILGVICIVFTNALLLSAPWVMKRAVDGLQAGTTPGNLLFYAALIVGISALQGVFRFAMRHLMIGVSRDVEYDLRNDLFAHLETLPLRFFQKNRTGDLMSRATNDLSNVRMLLGPGIMYTANTLLIGVSAVVLMLSIDWRLTLLSLLPMPFVSVAVRRFGQRIHHLTEQSQSRLADLSARVQESLAGVRVVRAFVQEAFEMREFGRLNDALIFKNYELIRVTAIFYPLLQFTIGLSMLGVLWYGGYAVIGSRISLGDFVAFTVYLGMLAWPMIAVGWVVNLLERGRASMERLNFIFDAEAEIRDAQSPRLVDIQGEIEFRNLSFSYNGTPVLHDVSLRIPQGKIVAIVGATGAGKSTLVQLIPRLFDAPRKSIFIDGVPVEDLPLETLRRSIGFVPQDTFLFGETVGENIAFGVEGADIGSVERAAEVSQVLEDIREFPMGFETLVGERGITLSGGQKQRTAISRAVIRNPRILILDDALSSVDTYTEERVLGHMREVMRGRTSLLISHRVSTVKDADEIVVLERGRIVERGTHATLVERDGYYAELHRRQLLEDELQQTG